WRSGGVEEWRSGGVEEWRSGGVEEWRSGTGSSENVPLPFLLSSFPPLFLSSSLPFLLSSFPPLFLSSSLPRGLAFERRACDAWHSVPIRLPMRLRFVLPLLACVPALLLAYTP